MPFCPGTTGGTVQTNGQATAEIQEVALTNMGTTASSANKRHSSHDKGPYPRANLTTITTLGMEQCMRTHTVIVNKNLEKLSFVTKNWFLVDLPV